MEDTAMKNVDTTSFLYQNNRVAKASATTPARSTACPSCPTRLSVQQRAVPRQCPACFGDFVEFSKASFVTYCRHSECSCTIYTSINHWQCLACNAHFCQDCFVLEHDKVMNLRRQMLRNRRPATPPSSPQFRRRTALMAPLPPRQEDAHAAAKRRY